MYTSLALQNGHTQAEARVMGINAAQGVYGYINKYKKDIQQLTEEELKFMKSHDADEVYRNLSPEDRAFYALTGQFSPNTMINGLVGGISVSDSFKTEKVGEGKYKRKLITTDKNVVNFGLNNGDSLTASATLAETVPNIKKELSKGNSAPLRQLRMLPALANIVQSDNQDEGWIKAKQELADMLSTELVRNSKTYYKGRNVINDEMDYQNRATVELAQYLGFSNEETKDIINKALETMGLKHINGVYTEDELAGAMSAMNIMPWAMEGVEPQQRSVNVEDYLDDSNRMSMAPEPEDEFIDDEEAQMTKVNVYESPEFIDFRNKIMKAAREGRIEPDQARNEIDLKKKEIENATNNKEALIEANKIIKLDTKPLDEDLYKRISESELSEAYKSDKRYVDGDNYIVHNDGDGNPTVGTGVLLDDTNKQVLRLSGYNGSFNVGDKIPKNIVDEVSVKVFNNKARNAIRICNNNGVDLSKHPELKKLCIDANYNGALPKLLKSFREYINNPSKKTVDGIMTAVKDKAKKIWKNRERRKWWIEVTNELPKSK